MSSIPESKIEARTALIAAFQQDASKCIEEWALYKCACDVLNGEDIIEVCAHQPVTTMQVEQCIETQRRRAVTELTTEMVARIRKQNEERTNEL
tara:strand:- start:911 stop:1192 length:282 start_codon:yes stop_codon:yes gene_type:complete